MEKEMLLTKLQDAGLVAVVRANNSEEAIKISDNKNSCILRCKGGNF